MFVAVAEKSILDRRLNKDTYIYLFGYYLKWPR